MTVQQFGNGYKPITESGWFRKRTIYGKLANNESGISNQNGRLFKVWC